VTEPLSLIFHEVETTSVKKGDRRNAPVEMLRDWIEGNRALRRPRYSLSTTDPLVLRGEPPIDVHGWASMSLPAINGTPGLDQRRQTPARRSRHRTSTAEGGWAFGAGLSPTGRCDESSPRIVIDRTDRRMMCRTVQRFRCRLFPKGPLFWQEFEAHLAGHIPPDRAGDHRAIRQSVRRRSN